jgi:hypothetical protein
MFARGFAQHAPQRVNRLREIGFLDHHVRPERLHESGLIEELPGALDEIEEGVEDPAGDLEGLSAGARLEHAPLFIQPKLAELVDQGASAFRS